MYAFAWYVAASLMTVAGLVPAAVLFPGLASRGVHFARPLGMALVALLTWLVVHLTPVPYGTPVVFLSLGAVAVCGVVAGIARSAALRPTLARWREFAIVEGLAMAVFVVVLLMRMQTPDAWGTEKPADLMLLTAVHRAETFPPLDPWAAGEHLSYYYLGQVQVDHLARIAGASPAEAFNLATAMVAAMVAAAAAGLAMDIVRSDTVQATRRVGRRVVALAGGLAVASMLLAAPLAGLAQVLAANGVGSAGAWGRLGVEGVPSDGGATDLVPDAFWWWWPTTRVVPDVISEYPAFSLILGDPHPHLLALPLGLTALALAVQVFAGTTPLSWLRWVLRPDRLLLTSALFAALALTSSWDVLTYGAIWAAAGWWAATRAGWPPHTAGLIVVRWAALPAVGGLLLASPFFTALDPAPLGLAFVRGESSDLPRWLLFWLPALLPGLAGALFLARPQPVTRSQVIVLAGVLGLLPLVWAAAMLMSGDGAEVWRRGAGWATVVVLIAGVAGVLLRSLSSARDHRGQETALWLLGAAGAVLLATEFVHIDDQFPGRLNTVFKFWFHAWAIVSVAGGALLAMAVDRWLTARSSSTAEDARVRQRPGRMATAVFAGAGLIWVASTVTPPLMAISRARETQDAGLSAIAHLEERGDGLYAAVTWGLETLDPARDVVVEAVDESYGDGNRFSSFTGVATLLGWPGHERQWRADVREAERRDAVAAIYLGDGAARDRAVRDWGVTHVLVGDAERIAFGPTPAITQAGWPLAFEDGVTQVFEVPASVRGAAGTETR